MDDMNEAMGKIKAELGKDAVIISTRKVKKSGILGFFGKKRMEVTAAVDNSEKVRQSGISYRQKDESMEESIKALKRAMEKHANVVKKEEIVPKPPSLDRAAASEVVRQNKEQDVILNEVKEMKNLILNISNGGLEKEKEKDPLREKLEASDINMGIIDEILSEVGSENREEKLKNVVEQKISVCDVEEDGIIILVGPTGVGKTTTIAKLAGRFSLVEKKKVGLITVDTYRIGAVEQLRTYSDIMNIPFKVVLSLKEMDEAIKSMKDCEIILIDTTGRSSKNEMQISELRAFIERTKSDNIHLVLSSTTKDKDIKAITKGYSKLNYKSVIITKLDETMTYGSILNILKYANCPISYITVGQNVPDDMKKVTAKELGSLILGEDSIC